ncbi:nitroreductase family protein [Paraburkholderia sp. BL6665CI2N2]|uniref:Acg family FMN-binding oxidoreductase n=1 Tax=Paraburkholderia sp. BL6665CI2N2 TaxID=1938806 RepID=UPI0010662AD5|nr:nitroreductase family protein [Paraburkholderia sp. BL6665CI2N2]TDY19910.1 nitroreductase family protein [Paraburkholderia sp. BL6665CI2N2]
MNTLVQTTAWSVDEQQFDPHASIEEKLRFALRYAVLAPSNHNTQPWHFLVDGECVTLCADRMRALPVVDPFDRELIISCGAALFNLRVALSRFGLAYAITPFPSTADVDVLAQLRVIRDGRCDVNLVALFGAILRRVTTRETFVDEPVQPESRRQLVEAGTLEGCDIVCVEDVASREQLAALIGEADQAQFRDPRFRRELASWIHPRRLQGGMPALSPGARALLDFGVPLVSSIIRTFDLGGGMAAAHHTLVRGSPLLLCIAAGTDDAPAWFAAGQALERALLTAASEGLTASYLNQPIEVAALRERLRAALNLDGAPQLLIRVGRGAQAAHSPRRPLDQVVS